MTGPVTVRSTPRRLVAEIRLRAVSGAPLAASWEHGETHWRQVAEVGLWLAARTMNCHPWVPLLFGLIHDARRVDDGPDPEHGRRAAQVVVQAAALLEPLLDSAAREVLALACRDHCAARIATAATCAVCWDADRLLYVRGGAPLDARQLSTMTASSPIAERHARRVLASEPAPWEALVDRAAQLAAHRQGCPWT